MAGTKAAAKPADDAAAAPAAAPVDEDEVPEFDEGNEGIPTDAEVEAEAGPTGGSEDADDSDEDDDDEDDEEVES